VNGTNPFRVSFKSNGIRLPATWLISQKLVYLVSSNRLRLLKLILMGFVISQSAYAAAVYIHCAYPPTGIPVISLIMAKTRVAPLNQVSLPRLELCGAHLLALLVTSVKTALKIPIRQVRCWKDSTIVLS
jgi:hypothetical protein